MSRDWAKLKITVLHEGSLKNWAVLKGKWEHYGDLDNFYQLFILPHFTLILIVWKLHINNYNASEFHKVDRRKKGNMEYQVLE